MSKHVKRAAQNREDLLEAAIEMFKLHGMMVPLQVIIDHAHVGRATFYRNFADRKALIYALLGQALQALEHRAKPYYESPDGLILLIQSHVFHLNQLSVLMEYWRVLDYSDPTLQQLITQHKMIIQPLIDRAIAQQLCRSDFSFEDYRSIITMLSSCFRGHDQSEQIRLASRVIELLLNGIIVKHEVQHG
ncbi:TetR/AcrR family transcriptional regulator [Acinetobacter soli]|uniref:HTH tetR-type domain-containing protein n=1 Tax=Acinetobacter soli NIPH 2899 TaxID=1217677 RepID=A0ABP2UAM3_9GAMM|nr:TetR/AcrR family transcriptional regulator [Acinetobacter soli]ENV60810.1 hypothetical protein F950_01536 [Acinetobacter soli NIPH 2899]